MQLAFTDRRSGSRTNTARIELKTTPEVKVALEQAAIESGVSLTAFIVGRAYEEAKKLIDSRNVTRLNEVAWEALDKHMKSPTNAPNALRELMKR
ncbi:DUF1778 domain-containing protein [Bowmanella denitrificans]|uniref:type II toxin-antitoxin system TacA family antitoxin n=1 Tax=Bowmanella denitrificans TaxID=366582 RepID=UPI000C9BF9ED|nr:DUF1778 domain-containing protein [Bowmanella denitrificans]